MQEKNSAAAGFWFHLVCVFPQVKGRCVFYLVCVFHLVYVMGCCVKPFKLLNLKLVNTLLELTCQIFMDSLPQTIRGERINLYMVAHLNTHVDCRTCQKNVRTVSGACQDRVRSMSGPCQVHVRTVSGACQEHVRSVSGACQERVR